MIKPGKGYILVEPIKEEKTPGGVYRPEAAKEKPMKGKVIAVGGNLHWHYNAANPMRELPVKDCEANIGDVIYYKKWGNEEVEEDGKEYVFLRFDDVLGIKE